MSYGYADAQFDKLMEEIESRWQQGGFTLRLDGTPPECGEDDWVASLVGYEQRFITKPSRLKIHSYVNRCLQQLVLPGRNLGGWRCAETGLFFLDVSMVFHDLESALEFARKNRQVAIYNPFMGELVNVGEEHSLVAA